MAKPPLLINHARTTQQPAPEAKSGKDPLCARIARGARMALGFLEGNSVWREGRGQRDSGR
jgi:hypothetical protein